MTPKQKWARACEAMPLIAILRGINSEEITSVADVLIDAGFRLIEVPLNSPTPFKTIEKLAKHVHQRADTTVLSGAGTVLSADDVSKTVDAGGELIVSPDLNPAVAEAAQDCIYCPGVATPTEAFHAIRLEAAGIKLFPAELVTPAVVKAMRAVLPPATALMPVGGITPESMASYCSAGASGFGIGSALYKPGKSLDALRKSANDFTQAWEQIQSRA